MLCVFTVAVSLMLAESERLGNVIFQPTKDSLQCLNPSGSSVDYWYIFKYPGGLNYAYADSEDKTIKDMSGDTLDKASSPLSQTLSQAYHSSQSTAHAFWNDEHPGSNTVGSPWAHAKGAVAFGTQGGCWLTHSVPNFPNTVSHGPTHAWDDASTKYGQNFLCITVGVAALQQIGEAMLVNRVSVYDATASAAAGAAVPNFQQWANPQSSSHHRAGQSADSSKVLTVQSAGGTRFVVFAKSADFGKDLYDSLVAPALKASLITETWMNGKGDLPSTCNSHYQVMNSKSVMIGGHSWTDSTDHSKWAVTHDGTVLCMGDINRQSGQFSRGGGTVCIQDSKLGNQLKVAVQSGQNCDGSVAHVAHNLRNRPVLE